MELSTELSRDLAESGLTMADRFEQLKAESDQRLRNAAYRMASSRSDAEDLIQETYLKAWKAFAGYVPGRPFLNWLLRIMRHAYLDIRSRDNPIRCAGAFGTLTDTSTIESLEHHLPDPGDGPEECLLKEVYMTELAEALSHLPAKNREAIVLCDLQRYSYSEVAGAQQTSLGTVRSRIHRGRQLLRNLISDSSGARTTNSVPAWLSRERYLVG
jgi:RNA polymerase sigma-70 factor (ECF subfamily)